MCTYWSILSIILRLSDFSNNGFIQHFTYHHHVEWILKNFIQNMEYHFLSFMKHKSVIMEFADVEERCSLYGIAKMTDEIHSSKQIT